MATVNTKRGTTTQITCTTTSIANNVARFSAVVDDTSTLALDYMFSGLFTVGAAAATGPMYVLVYGYDGNNYAYPATGSDATIAMPVHMLGAMIPGQPMQKIPGTDLLFLTKVDLTGVAATVAVGIEPISISWAFTGGAMSGVPLKWGAVVVNCQGQSLDSTAAHNVIYYTAITQTVA